MALIRQNPLEGLTVRGVRRSFNQSPVKTALAAAALGAGAYWGLKSAKKSGPIGSALKGMLAVVVMNKAKEGLTPEPHADAQAV